MESKNQELSEEEIKDLFEDWFISVKEITNLSNGRFSLWLRHNNFNIPNLEGYNLIVEKISPMSNEEVKIRIKFSEK